MATFLWVLFVCVIGYIGYEAGKRRMKSKVYAANIKGGWSAVQKLLGIS